MVSVKHQYIYGYVCKLFWILFRHFFLSFSVIKHESEKVDLFELLYYTFKEEKLQRKRCYIRMQHLYYYNIGR